MSVAGLKFVHENLSANRSLTLIFPKTNAAKICRDSEQSGDYRRITELNGNRKSGYMAGLPAVQDSAMRDLRAAASPRVPWGTYGLRFAALSYLALFILIPLIVISVQGFREGLDVFWTNLTRPAALSAIGLTLWTAAVMTVIN